MSSAFCGKCGSPLQGDTAFCPKCGARVAGATGTTRSDAQSIEVPTPPVPGRPRKRGLAIAIIVIVVVIVVAAFVLLYEYQPGNALNPYKVHVLEVVWTQSGTPYQTESGFTVDAGKVAHVSVTLTCSSFLGIAQTCSSGSVYVETPGFGVSSTNAPFTWSSGSTSATAAVNAAITTPSSSYTGNLTIDLH